MSSSSDELISLSRCPPSYDVGFMLDTIFWVVVMMVWMRAIDHAFMTAFGKDMCDGVCCSKFEAFPGSEH